jgi:hypothetical protein
MTGDKRLASAQIAGSKKDKERLSVVVCCNADGTCKLPCWVLGKFAKPRCFKNIDTKEESLGVVYKSNTRAWMTKEIFHQFCKWFDKKMSTPSLLLVDNCPSHIVDEDLKRELQKTRIEFFPKNTTPLIQPCDAGLALMRVSLQKRM